MKVCPSCEGLNYEQTQGGVYLANRYKCLDCEEVFEQPVEVSEEEPDSLLEEDDPIPANLAEQSAIGGEPSL